MAVYLLLMLLLSIGNAELLITAVNRVHSRPLPAVVLREIRHLHDLLIPLFPSWLIVVVGWFGPGVLRRPVPVLETWAGLPLMVQIWFGCCLLGFAGFVWSVVRYWLTRTPPHQVALQSEVEDVAQSLGFVPRGEGPFRSMTKLPFNECFQVEWTTRTLKLPRLPAAIDGLTILQVSDLHFIGTIDRPWFEHIFERASQLEADLIVCTGDILDGAQFTDWLPTTLGRLHAPLGCYFILGNHDWHLEPQPIREAVAALGWRDVSSTVQMLDIAGGRLAIGGSERPWMGRQPDFRPLPSDAFRLLLSHSPDNFQWARRERIDLMLSGHNHGGQVRLPGIGPVYSPSAHGCRYSGGLYWSDPTLMFVNRGLSGRHPLRIGARPEVTRLILKRS